MSQLQKPKIETCQGRNITPGVKKGRFIRRRRATEEGGGHGDMLPVFLMSPQQADPRVSLSSEH